MYHARIMQTGSRLVRNLRQASRFSQDLRLCSSKPPPSETEQVLYEEYTTPDGGKYRLDYDAHKNFKAEDWHKFEHAFQIDHTPTDEEIDEWVEANANSEDWEVVHIPANSSGPIDDGEPEALPRVDEFDEYEKPVRSMRELKRLEMFNDKKRDDKKNAQAMRALRLSREMEVAAVRALDADGGGTDDGLEICRATLSDNLRDLTIVIRSDLDGMERNYDEMGKKVKAEIAQSVRTKFIPKVWFKRAKEEDEKRMELERLFERIARERG